jgi:hypothetical protein
MLEEKYYDIRITDTKRYRLFKKDIDAGELMWHQDQCDRKVLVISGIGWKIQFDDELPIDMNVGEEIEITNHKFHRLLKGRDNLIIKIIEINKN